jgi:hypothetical protein
MSDKKEISLQNGAKLILEPASYEDVMDLQEYYNELLVKNSSYIDLLIEKECQKLDTSKEDLTKTEYENILKKVIKDKELILMANEAKTLRFLTLKCLEKSIYQDKELKLCVNPELFNRFPKTRSVHKEIMQAAQKFNLSFFLAPPSSESANSEKGQE